MKNLLYLIFVFAFIFASCRDQIYYTGDDVDCYNCYTDFPEEAYIKIEFTTNNENSNIPITIYNGLVDKSPIVFDTIADSSPLYVGLPVNEIYTVKAAYFHNGDSIFAIDNAKVQAFLVTDMCDEDCWIIKHRKYNVRLIQ
ncbi:MAG: hypothetical protein GX879_01495 [Bacteroidales bacterium]|nr:hypothetical protein [Bacteroidales bacterium]